MFGLSYGCTKIRCVLLYYGARGRRIMSILTAIFNIFGLRREPMSTDDEPYMEHPTGRFASALEAITWCITQLHTVDFGERWITFCGQGQAAQPDAIAFADVRYRPYTFDLSGEDVDLNAVMSTAQLDRALCRIESNNGYIALPDATPDELGRFLNALFLTHYRIMPFAEDNDYSIGAEWL